MARNKPAYVRDFLLLLNKKYKISYLNKRLKMNLDKYSVKEAEKFVPTEAKVQSQGRILVFST